MNSTTIDTALQRTSEASDLDFKGSFDGSTEGWIELVKDIAAMANSGGGVILFGIDDNGDATAADLANLLDVDPAHIADKLHKYTGVHFGDCELIEARRGEKDVVLLTIPPASMPMVFVKPGTVAREGGGQKTVFSQGTVYFRHGAKSEPGTTEDLRQSLERELESRRSGWLEAIARVIESPKGSRVAILPPSDTPAGVAGALPMTLTSDPSAPQYYALPLDQTHPHRQKEVVELVNRALSGQKRITSHDILCVRRVHETQKNIIHCYTQRFASPRYSQAFVDWLIASYRSDPAFFDTAREQYDVLKGD